MRQYKNRQLGDGKYFEKSEREIVERRNNIIVIIIVMQL